MEMYKKPVMEIVELEKVDVLTASYRCEYCDEWIWENGKGHKSNCETLSSSGEQG